MGARGGQGPEPEFRDEGRGAADTVFGGGPFGADMTEAGFKGFGDAEPAGPPDRAEAPAVDEHAGDEAAAGAYEDLAVDDATADGSAQGAGAQEWPDGGGAADGSWSDPASGGAAGAADR
ncbi:hypothetical protein [Streptomyces sp. NPDC056883]|uniref:hypothetical protein n=1 Tax=Streptomyces sp. NPDC056883 TaxID=3345959 RepID=UPI0036A2B6AD